jgi:hypothetical protein
MADYFLNILLVFGQAEQAFAEDVALNFTGARDDRQHTGVENQVEPARAVRHRRAGLVD